MGQLTDNGRRLLVRRAIGSSESIARMIAAMPSAYDAEGEAAEDVARYLPEDMIAAAADARATRLAAEGW